MFPSKISNEEIPVVSSVSSWNSHLGRFMFPGGYPLQIYALNCVLVDASSSQTMTARPTISTWWFTMLKHGRPPYYQPPLTDSIGSISCWQHPGQTAIMIVTYYDYLDSPKPLKIKSWLENTWKHHVLERNTMFWTFACSSSQLHRKGT